MPKGGKSSLVPVRAGLRHDLDNFYRSFLQLKSTQFLDFKKLFESTGMTAIFSGRSYYAEIIEFNECILCSCLEFLKPNLSASLARSVEERMFGVYALYTFYYLQAVDHVVQIRMDPDMIKEFNELVELLHSSRHLDAYSCCLKLIEDNAIKIVAFLDIHDPSSFKRFDTDENLDNIKVLANVNAPMASARDMIKSKTFIALNICHKKYLAVRSKLKEEDWYQMSNPLEDIYKIIDKHENNFDENRNFRRKITETYTSAQRATRGRQRLEIKDKAYSSELVFERTRRHRNADGQSIYTASFEFENEEKEEVVAIINEELPHSTDFGDLNGLEVAERMGRKPKAEIQNTRKRVKKESTNRGRPKADEENPVVKRGGRPKKNTDAAHRKMVNISKEKKPIVQATDAQSKTCVHYNAANQEVAEISKMKKIKKDPSVLHVEPSPKGRKTNNSLMYESDEKILQLVCQQSAKEEEQKPIVDIPRKRIRFDCRRNKIHEFERGAYEDDDNEDIEMDDDADKDDDPENQDNISETNISSSNKLSSDDADIEVKEEILEMETEENENKEVHEQEEANEEVINYKSDSESSEGSGIHMSDLEEEDMPRNLRIGEDNDYFFPDESDVESEEKQVVEELKGEMGDLEAYLPKYDIPVHSNVIGTKEECSDGDLGIKEEVSEDVDLVIDE